jgi:hypothetical protein
LRRMTDHNIATQSAMIIYNPSNFLRKHIGQVVI